MAPFKSSWKLCKAPCMKCCFYICNIKRKCAQRPRKIDNWGGGAHIHIFVLCITDFPWNQLFSSSLNTNIWICAPPQLSIFHGLWTCGKWNTIDVWKIKLKLSRKTEFITETIITNYMAFQNYLFWLVDKRSVKTHIRTVVRIFRIWIGVPDVVYLVGNFASQTEKIFAFKFCNLR
jgi:hypothetical protein